MRPYPTRDIDQALLDLTAHGLCLLTDALDPDTLARARQAIYAASAADLAEGRASTGFQLDNDANNRRVWNLLNRDPVFATLAEHPTAMRLVRHVLGWPALLSNISGNITQPGTIHGELHADQVFVPEPWPARPQGINVLWCLDAFTAENGATEVALGSHLLHRNARASDEPIQMTPIEAPAGSIVAFESRLWHRSGANTTQDTRRAGVFPFYTKPIYRPQENWFLSLDEHVHQHASDTLLTLLGYKTEVFGLVYGQSPS